MKTAYDHVVDLLVGDPLGWVVDVNELKHQKANITIRRYNTVCHWEIPGCPFVTSYWEQRRLERAIKKMVAARVRHNVVIFVRPVLPPHVPDRG